MTTARTPTRNRGNRRAEILDAAARLFASRGFHGVSIEDIGAAVGVSGPALYRHFAGKEALLAELLLDVSSRLRESAAAVVTSAATPAASSAETLSALLDVQITFALEQPALITVHDRELGNVPEPHRRRIRRLQRLYVEEWVTVLAELHPACPAARLRAATHAVFGLLNSTPHSAGELPARDMRPLLRAMARAAIDAAVNAR
ncbi:TetR/AcrR family transcriptional regulator [Nonomuraea sp. NPDC005501]|uniref:SACE_7040 family transcriptional regulator n=1 Tax=Nonomuraea sp. NPDC005501 TaxID=3156884 RepID=UPI00339F77BE